MLRITTLVLLFYMSKIAMASDLIVLSEDVRIPKAVNGYVDVFEDETNTITIEELTNPEFEGFKKNRLIYPEGINKHATSSYWLRYKIKCSQPNQKWVIMYYNEHIDSLEFYYKENNGTFRKQLAGHHIPFKYRTYKNIEPVFDLPSDTEEQYVYLRVKSSRASGLSNKIMPLNEFIQTSMDRYISESAFYGFLFFLLTSAILLYLGSKEEIYLYYAFFVFALAVFMIERGALAFGYLWPDQPFYNDLLESIAAPLLIVALWLYTNALLQFFNVVVKGKWVNAMMTAYLAYHLIVLFCYGEQILIITNAAIDLGLMYFFFIRILKHLWKVKLESYLFMIGIACVPLSYTLHFLRELDFFNSSFISSSFNYGLLLDAILFSYALSHRFKKLKAQKNHNLKMYVEQLEENKIVRERVNTELENLVQQRTDEILRKNEELENANNQLTYQAELINKMNLQLDVKNHALNKKVSQISKARVLKEAPLIDDFNESFPNDESCYYYMQEQKWGSQFTCIKCARHDYVKGQKPFTRRCTNCHQQESVIYNTFLEGTRLKIKNAFMMIYLVLESDGKISAYDLEKLTGTSRKSCGKFKKQILERLEVLKKQNVKQDIRNVLFY